MQRSSHVYPALLVLAVIGIYLAFLAVGREQPIAYAAAEATMVAPSQIYLPVINRAESSAATPVASATATATSIATATGTTATPTPTATTIGATPATATPIDSSPATPTLTPTPAEPTPTSWLTFFVDSQWKTSNASVAVDANGGEHVAFYYYEPSIEDRPTYAVYVYCPSQCENEESWHGVALADSVNEVQLQLNPAGKPRLMIRTNSTVYTGGNDYFYAACDGDCTTLEGWTLTLVLSSNGTASLDIQRDELPQRYFALDPEGRPRFVYLDRNHTIVPNHIGVFYAFCDEDCTQQANWAQTRITTVIQEDFRFDWETLYYPSLAFTTDGRPRVATAEFFPMDDSEATLAFFECNEACDVETAWAKVQLYARGGGAEPSADLEIDANGHPHIAFYQEAMLGGEGERLIYAWCLQDFCRDARNWDALDLGLGANNGEEPDLELDAQGHPRIAYAMGDNGGLGYSWCDVDCDSTSAQWQHTVVETREQLQAAWPVPYPGHCDAGIWNSLTPTLVLDSEGDPHVAYDATYHARCFYDDNPNDNIPPESRYELVMRAVRVNIFTQP